MSTATTSILYTFTDPATVPGAIFYALVILILAWIVAHVLHLLISRHLDRAEATGMDSTSFRFLDQLGKVVVYILGFFLYTHFSPALSGLGAAWLTSVGVVSLVIGLAAQSTLSNLVAGISLILYRPFHIGDRIEVSVPTGTEIGRVESVDLGYTILRTADGRKLVFSNSTIANLTSINLSRNQPHIPCDVTVVLAKDANVEHAQEIMLAVAKTHSQIKKVMGAFVTTIAGSGITINLSMYCNDPADVAPIKSEVLAQIKKKFDAEQISLA